jgi:ubiquitin-conjugating enzyme E2 O
LTKLYDGIDQLEDDMWDEMSENHAGQEENPLWTINEEGGVWEPAESESGDDWPEYGYGDEEDERDGEVPMVNGDGRAWPDVPLGPLEVVPGLISSELLSSIYTGPETPPAEVVPSPNADEVERLPSPDVPKDAADNPPPEDLDSEDESELPWKRFEVLSSAPQDHAYYNSPPAQPSKSFLGRLTREYRVLANSLPGPSTYLRCSSYVNDDL